MKVTKSQLKRIIKEEIGRALKEGGSPEQLDEFWPFGKKKEKTPASPAAAPQKKPLYDNFRTMVRDPDVKFALKNLAQAWIAWEKDQKNIQTLERLYRAAGPLLGAAEATSEIRPEHVDQLDPGLISAVKKIVSRYDPQAHSDQRMAAHKQKKRDSRASAMANARRRAKQDARGSGSRETLAMMSDEDILDRYGE